MTHALIKRFHNAMSFANVGNLYELQRGLNRDTSPASEPEPAPVHNVLPFRREEVAFTLVGPMLTKARFKL